MARINPYTLQMQITRMFEQGQSLFATTKVQDWLRERNQNPQDYEIIFQRKPAPPGSNLVMIIEIELRRKDGQPVDPWLQEQVNLHG
ncbi:MAG: hypothetical protein SAL07_13180 [Oscillatoria sp. PMC 1051.18]|uniref:hypothetical protein n=1 Tax=Oscillatoria salina TaxID=331517 RepID=UPI0013BA6F0D|nr:hypothetical protein [Oscillatoria salina]MBZ8181775.1 hypothetical protein [Oscillatoria salina IIICB1]MEC4891887.1 hypothetical protein [Oscillatoria sp. PMC 1050.18]MEC5030845.1 hypothetical protein [Oscillatoria sp. PMC 1051.18]NET90518.1 hypothetical protein [Kamptonema sp. SIO1D9]